MDKNSILALRRLYDTYTKIPKLGKEFFRALVDIDIIKDREEEISTHTIAFDVFIDLMRVKTNMQEPFLSISDVSKITGFTKRQLLYWNEKGLKLNFRSNPKRSWRKFSLLDIFGFKILERLLDFGLSINQCEFIFEWLRQNIAYMPFFLFHFADGDSVFIIIDIKQKAIQQFYTSESDSLMTGLRKIDKPSIIIPLSPILCEILQKVPKRDFGIKITTDKNNVSKVLFFVEGKWIELHDKEKFTEVFPMEIFTYPQEALINIPYEKANHDRKL